MPTTPSLKLAKKVLNLIKKSTISSNDIIPFDELPFLYRPRIIQYTRQFGPKKISDYLQHLQQSEEVREQAKLLFTTYQNLISSPGSTLKIAISLCGFGECDETSQRAAIELLAMDCEEIVNIVLLRGKPRIPDPNPSDACDYYTHMTVVMGFIPVPVNTNPLAFFPSLPDSHILLDASLNVIGAANKTLELLASLFRHWEIELVEQVVEINPPKLERVAYAKGILANAKEISEIIMTNLNITKNRKPPRQDMFFSHPERKYKDLDSKRISLLVDDDKLDWDSCMQRFRP